MENPYDKRHAILKSYIMPSSKSAVVKADQRGRGRAQAQAGEGCVRDEGRVDAVRGQPPPIERQTADLKSARIIAASEIEVH